MVSNRNATVQRLLEVFARFHRVNWYKSPIGNLKPNEIMVLLCVKKKIGDEELGIKVSDISRLLKVATPTVTQIINNLEADGLVERSMDKEDRRAVRINLTGKGDGIITEVFDEFIYRFNGLVKYLGEDKSNELADLLSKVFIYFNDMEIKN